MRRRTYIVFPFVVAASLVGVAFWLFVAFIRPGPLTEPRTVVIEPGRSLDEIAAVLADKGVVSDPRVFAFGVRLARKDSALLPGEYQFGVAFSPRAVMNLLVSGRRIPHKLVVQEGLTTAQVLKLVEKADGLDGPITITPGEGALLPQTYQYFWGDSRDGMIERMVYAMDQTIADLWAQRPPDTPLQTPAEAVVLASIVAKESGQPKERPTVASVLTNRLKRGMKLESDVTVAYGIARADQLPETVLKRRLTRTDLKRATPYNTYLNPGLPPTPICNVGRETLHAALHPAKTTYLFFAATGSSGNAFARTVDEHNRNVERLRARTAAKKNGGPPEENEAMVPEGVGEASAPPR
ncbi:MAG: endolytic transglycosylase MltG [Gemmatimonas sp.]